MMRTSRSGNYLWGIIFFLSISCIISLPRECFGKEQVKNMEFVSILGINRILSNSFPSNPMMEDMTELKIAPGIFTYKNGNNGKCSSSTTCNETIQSEDGQGISLSLIHAYSPHFGIGIIGGYVNNDGSIGAESHSQIGYTDSRQYSGPIEGGGGAVAATIILDPFSDPDGFRLPFILGFSYQNTSQDWDVPFAFTTSTGSTLIGHRGQDKGKYSMQSFGYYTGISMQFSTGPFRWSPFGFLIYPVSKPELTWTVKNLNTGNSVTVTEEEGADFPMGIGIPITYKPWGLNFTYIVDTGGRKEGGQMTTYILSWAKKW